MAEDLNKHLSSDDQFHEAEEFNFDNQDQVLMLLQKWRDHGRIFSARKQRETLTRALGKIHYCGN